MTHVHHLDLRIANAALLRGDGLVLVDAGNIGGLGILERALARHGVTFRDLDLILLTHAHADHFGDAPLIRERTGVPIAVHQLDAPLLSLGHNATLHPTDGVARLVRPLFDVTFTPFTADLPFTHLDLRAHGVGGMVLHTPGHTAGSVSILLDDGHALLGDLLRGSFIRRDAPALHLFADDVPTVFQSLDHVLRHDLRQASFGHGRPANAAALRRFARRAAHHVARRAHT